MENVKGKGFFVFFLTPIFRVSPQITEVFFYFSRNFLFNGKDS